MKKTFSDVSLEYCFDRLIEKKLELAYEVLVPETAKKINQSHGESKRHEDNSNLCESFVATTKR